MEKLISISMHTFGRHIFNLLHKRHKKAIFIEVLRLYYNKWQAKMNKYTKTQSNLLFKDSEVRGYRWSIFEQTELGKIYSTIPFSELSQLLTLKARNSIGAPSWFDSEGMFAVMFLKAYLGLSDRKLIDRINSDWELQMFCGKQFPENERIKDRNLPSRIRSYIGNNLCLEQFQSVMIENWQPYIDNTHCGMADATVYESYIKYPTDEKLL